jgi:uncharacterized protein
VEGLPWTAAAGGLTLTVTPKGGRDSIEGVARLADGKAVLKARGRAAASEGGAHAALVRLVADALGIAPSRVVLTGGATARVKRLTIAGNAPTLAARLVELNNRGWE